MTGTVYREIYQTGAKKRRQRVTEVKNQNGPGRISLWHDPQTKIRAIPAVLQKEKCEDGAPP